MGNVRLKNVVRAARINKDGDWEVVNRSDEFKGFGGNGISEKLRGEVKVYGVCVLSSWGSILYGVNVGYWFIQKQ